MRELPSRGYSFIVFISDTIAVVPTLIAKKWLSFLLNYTSFNLFWFQPENILSLPFKFQKLNRTS
jgi:hypothetical protein